MLIRRELRARGSVLESSCELLLVGFEETMRGRVLEGVARFGHRVTEAEDGSSALRLAWRGRYDALVVSHPLPSAPTARFLDAVRHPESPCRAAGLVLVAPERSQREAEAYIGHGANRVLALERVGQALSGTLQPLLRVPPRSALRLPVRLEVAGRAGLRRVLCETVNLSRNGALVRVPHSLPTGTELRFELFLTGGRRVPGTARVVRQTTQRREPYPGLGLEFTELDRGAEDLLGWRLAAPHGPVN